MKRTTIVVEGAERSGFKFPPIVLNFKTIERWFIEVEGRIEDFLTDADQRQEWPNEIREKHITLATRTLIKHLERFEVVGIGVYDGSGGPSHLLRDGKLYRRTSSSSREFTPVEFTDPAEVICRPRGG
jgi:hypothetical protein